MPTHCNDRLLQASALRYDLLADAQVFNHAAVSPLEPADALALAHSDYQASACIDAWMPPADNSLDAYRVASAQTAPSMRPQPEATGVPRHVPLWPQYDTSSFDLCFPVPIEEQAVIDPAALQMAHCRGDAPAPLHIAPGASQPSGCLAQPQGRDERAAIRKSRMALRRYALVNANTGKPATADDTSIIHQQTWQKRRPVDAQSGLAVPVGTPGAVPRWRYERTRWPQKYQAKGSKDKQVERS